MLNIYTCLIFLKMNADVVIPYVAPRPLLLFQPFIRNIAY